MTKSPATTLAVRMASIYKSFGGVRALKGVDLEVEAGEIHALLGENGAGKSTVLKVLRGLYLPDSGDIDIFGTRVTAHTPEEARSLGVSMIFQELSLIPTMTVAQNVLLVREPLGRGRLIDDREAHRRTSLLCAQFGIDIDPQILVSRLSTGQRQLIEIVKALSQDARVLILDEPTSALTTRETKTLFEILRRLKAQGVAIIYVSHRIDEVSKIAERVTVFRDGVNVVTGTMADLGVDGVVRAIVGKDVSAFERIDRQPVDDSSRPVLEVMHLAGESLPVDISFILRSGEIIGIGGLMGSGRTELARILTGVDPIVGGEMRVQGEPVKFRLPRDAIDAGIALVPEDRVLQGLILQHSIGSNICLPIWKRLLRNGLINKRAAASTVDGQIERLHIKTPSRNELVRRLSGGNQQKVVLAKWLAAGPQILILDEPTAGVDIGSKAEIVALIRRLADEGKSIMVISSELPELLALSDRILVMTGGVVSREITNVQIAQWTSEHDSVATSHAYAEKQLTLAIQGVSET